MEAKCPNCKGNAKAVQTGGVDYIRCSKCGWFAKEADGTYTAYDPPQEPNPSSGGDDPGAPSPPSASPPTPKKSSTPSSAKPAGDGPSPSPDPATDEGGIEIELTDKIEY